MARSRIAYLAWAMVAPSFACAGTTPTPASQLVMRPQAPEGDCQAQGELVGRSALAAGQSEAQLRRAAELDLEAQAAARGLTHLHLTRTDLTPAGAEAHATGYVCQGPVSFGAGSMLGATDPRLAQAVPRATPSPAQTTRPARARPARQTTSIGSTEEKPGCLEGHAYPMTNPDGLPSDYDDKEPAAALWGCEWNIGTADGVQAFPGAQPGRRYAVRHQGAFTAPTVGIYIFHIQGDQPFRLTVGGKVLVDGAGGQVGQEAQVQLAAGEHAIKFEYVYTGGRAFDMEFDVQPPGGEMQPFSVAEGSPFYASQGLRYAGAARLGENWRDLVAVDDKEIHITKQVHFESDSTGVRTDDDSEAVLYAVARTMKDNPGIERIEVQGHTDDQGRPGYNMDLSQRRADAVRKWLVDTGIAPHRLVAKGYGAMRPLGGHHSEADRAKNRRVQFVVLKVKEGTSLADAPE